MEGPGKLNDMFESYTEDTNDSKLQWSEMGPKINDALPPKEEKKKRRFIWLWLLGAGIIFSVLFYAWSSLRSTYTDANDTPFTTYANSKVNKVDNTVAHSTIKAVDQISENKASIGLNDTISNRMVSDNRSTGISKELENLTESRKSIKNNNAVSTIDDNLNVGLKHKVSNQDIAINTFNNSDIDILMKEGTDVNESNQVLSEVQRVESLLAKSILNNNDSIPRANNFIEISQDSDIANELAASIYLYSGIELSNIADEYQNTKSLLGSSIEAGINIPINNRFFLSTGLSYQQHRFQTEFIQSEAIQIFKPETIDTIFNYGLDYQILVFTDFVDGVSTRSFGYTNTINTLSLPVEIGYSFKVGKVQVAPQVGLGLMINQQSMLRTADQFFEIESVNTTKSWSMFPLVRGGVSLQVPVLSRLSLAVKYNFSGQLLYSSNGTDRIHYIRHGAQLGIHFDL